MNLAWLIVNAMTFQESHDSDFADSATTFDNLLTLGFVHIDSLATNESFIGFNCARELAVINPHCQTDSMHHKPSCFLSDTQAYVRLHRN